MRFARPLLHALLPLLLPSILLAQGGRGTIRGQLADSAGAAIAQATVIVEGTGLRTTSNERGAYLVGGVPAGTYTVRVQRIGFATPTARVEVRSGETVQRDFTLAAVAAGLAAVQVVVGSRAQHTAADELAVPVDVFTPEEIRQQGTTETAQILQQLAPSVNFPRQSVSDASEIVRPFTMRGLSPDHTLVLLNGKRRHHTALIHYYGAGQGAGSSGVDMNAFPASAIARLEVLRDGAAAQYGSDAIAGVVNVVLKEGPFTPFLSAEYGQYATGEDNPAALPDTDGDRPSFPRDGETLDLNGGWGVALGRGSLGLFAEYRDREPTNRAGPDPVDMFTSGDADEVVNGRLVTKNNQIPQPNHHWGDGASKDLMTFATARFPLDQGGLNGLYAFGGYSFRQGTGFGYYRVPLDDRNWREIYPNGYLPSFAPDVTDYSAAGGVRGLLNAWSYDAGVTLGHNDFSYDLENTLNASLGPCLDTPCAPGENGILGDADDPDIPNKRNFFAGELRLDEMIASLDLSREMHFGLATPINVALGAAFRRENYEIIPGEPASYINGYHRTQDSTLAEAGSQVFPGFSPANATDEDRTNVGLYADLEADLIPRLLANVAARWEDYSDFGSKLTGKLALRFQPSPRLTLRTAVSTGFRAPSLNQSFYSSIVTNFKDDGTGTPVPFEIGIFPVASAEARALGARPLKAESSRNFSGGVAVSPVPQLTLTADYYYIAVDDRIVLTGFLDEPGVVTILQGIGSSAEAAQYFTNAIDSRTNGVDVSADYRVNRFGGDFGLSADFNYTRTTIPTGDVVPLPPELEGTGETSLVSPYDEGGLLAMTKERPRWRGTLATRYARGAWNGLVRWSHYGTYESALYSYSGDDVQKYASKGVLDLELGFTLMNAMRLSFGARNLFDTYPDRMSAANGFDIFPFPPASPFGYNGRFVYTRLELGVP